MRTAQQISTDIEEGRDDVEKLSQLWKEVDQNAHFYSYTDVWFWKQRLLRYAGQLGSRHANEVKAILGKDSLNLLGIK